MRGGRPALWRPDRGGGALTVRSVGPGSSKRPNMEPDAPSHADERSGKQAITGQTIGVLHQG